MDGSRCDQWATTLVTRTDRRRVLQGVSGLVAVVLGISRVELTAAKRDKHRTHRVRAEDAGARTSQTITVTVGEEILGDSFHLVGDSWLQASVTNERGGTRVDGLIDWHGVVLTGSAGTYRATNNLPFRYWRDTVDAFDFEVPTALTEQEGIFYYFGHADGQHELVVPNPPPVLVAFTLQVRVVPDGGIQASYRDVRLRCDQCRP